LTDHLLTKALRETIWLRRQEAADYARCSEDAFLAMRIPSRFIGGRKYFGAYAIDFVIASRGWDAYGRRNASSHEASRDLLRNLQEAMPKNSWKAPEVDEEEKPSVESPWLTEGEAANYARCSTSGFRTMLVPAKNSGGRKVYNKRDIDQTIESRPWAGSTRGRRPSSISPELRERLRGVRVRPYKPRKVRTSTDDKTEL